MEVANWQDYKNILVVRADNMGDLVMTTPALRALKETFDCKLTILTSGAGSLITGYIETIDDVIVYDAPWVKTELTEDEAEVTRQLINELKKRQFDAAIIFTVYSQSPLPAAMLAMMAGIPNRLAYCRENPYALLTKWIPDEEPYYSINHQVERDLNLVKFVGATTVDTHLSVNYSLIASEKAKQKMTAKGVDFSKPFVIFHAGVSEQKRQYPIPLWKEIICLFETQSDCQILLTGSHNELSWIQTIQQDSKAVLLAGLLAIDELIAIVDKAVAVLSVNTGTIHLAAALQTPVLVLYAQSNPQHTPWQVKNKVMPYSVPNELRSKNEVIRYVNDKLYQPVIPYPSPSEVVTEFITLLQENQL